MEILTFRCRIITPIFMAGADPNQAELRPPAIKSAIRFWWRVWKALPWEQLREEEAAIFGSLDEGVGRSKMDVSIDEVKGRPLEEYIKLPSFHSGMGKMTDRGAKGFSINVLHYLTYGCHEYSNRQITFTKPCFYPRDNAIDDTDFTLTIYCHESAIIPDILSALYLLTNYGGIGGKSRNGFGKIEIEGIYREVKKAGKDPYEFVSSIKAKLFQGPRQSYLSGSTDARFFELIDTHSSWHKALGEVGLAYRDMRMDLEEKHTYSKRVMVAQPIVANKKDVRDMFLERHAKYILLSVNEEVDNDGTTPRYRGSMLVLPYKYLDGIAHSDLAKKPRNNELSSKRDQYDRVYRKIIEIFEENENLQTPD